MDNYSMMRLSDNEDEDALDYDDLAAETRFESDAAAFKSKYKEFYTDIKIDISEDW